MKRAVVLLAALIMCDSVPAIAHDRYFFVQYRRAPDPPIFAGPFANEADCEAARSAEIALRRERLENAGLRYREALGSFAVEDDFLAQWQAVQARLSALMVRTASGRTGSQAERAEYRRLDTEDARFRDLHREIGLRRAAFGVASASLTDVELSSLCEAR